MPIKIERDSNGTTYIIPAADGVTNPRGYKLAGYPEVDVWWARSFHKTSGTQASETLIIRQEYPDREQADVLELTQGQVYDLIEALNTAMEKA